MLGKQACAVNRVPFYRAAADFVALKQPALQSNFPLLQKLGLAEKSRKGPHDRFCLVTGWLQNRQFPRKLVIFCFGAFLEWYMTACKDFDF